MRTFTWVAFVLVAMLASEHARSADPESSVFSPAKGVTAQLEVRGHEVQLSLVSHDGRMNDTLAIDTEKPLRIKVEDYNFDGYKDFAISHTDDGMGTYEIFYVYAYSRAEKKFRPLLPRCGDQFINLAIDRAGRTLTNSYFRGNRIRTCLMRY